MENGAWEFHGIEVNAVWLDFKSFDAIDVIVVIRKELAMIYAIVLKLRHIQRILGTIIVGIDKTIRDDLLTDDGQKRVGFGIRNHLCVDHASSLQNAQDRQSRTHQLKWLQ